MQIPVGKGNRPSRPPDVAGAPLSDAVEFCYRPDARLVANALIRRRGLLAVRGNRVSEARMGRVVFFTFVAAMFAALIVTVGWVHFARQADGPGRNWRGGALPVATTTVETRAFADVVEALGTVRATESVVITSRTTEVIRAVAFDSGDLVTVGDVLVEFTDAEETADLQEARAALLEVEIEFERITSLEARGVVAPAQVEPVKARLDRAQSRLQAVQAQRSDLVIAAPFSGVVGLRNASPGMLVRPGDVIATLDDISIVKVDFTVPERFLPVFTPGAPVELRAAAYPDEVFLGRVEQIDTRIDPVTRAATMRAALPNADGRVLPGMLMLVDARRNEREHPAVPEVALVRDGDEAFVFIVTQDDERGTLAQRRTVTTGARAGGFVEITSGLAPGETLVSEGVHRIRPGAPVRVPGVGPADGSPARGPRS